MAPVIPRYKNIQNYILNGIASGEFPNGTQIPTEHELSNQFNVSRMTVNKAITELSLQKVLIRIAGKGTFVAQQKAQSSSIHVVDIAMEIQNRGNVHSAKLLEKKMIPANESIALALGIYVGTQVVFCHLIHYENGVPILMEQRYVNATLAPHFYEQDFTLITPSSFLLANYALSEMEHTVDAIAATDSIAKYLQLSLGDPCLYICRRTWCEKELISFAQFTAAGSRYKLYSRINN